MAVRKPLARTPVRKAPKAGDWVALFDRNGKLIGITDPKNITPVSDGAHDTAAKALPKPKPSSDAEAAVGEQPQMGIAKRARGSAPATRQQLAKAEATLAEYKSRLYKSTDPAEQNEIRDVLTAASAEAFRRIRNQSHSGR